MPDVLTDPADALIAVETNLFALFRAMVAPGLPGSEIVEGEPPWRIGFGTVDVWIDRYLWRRG
ncbi:MAG: hypothetical protein WD670_04835 [Actinomycetota bacterium]